MTPDEVEAIRERVEAATPGPWFYDSYSRVQSAPLVQEWDPWSDPLVDTGHELERYGKCEACTDWPLPDGRSPQLGAGCRYASEAYQRDPDVASVPPLAGDTATGRHAADAQFIAHARADVPALLAALAEAQRERDNALLLVRSVVFYGTGFIWKRPDGTDYVLDPTEVVMVLSADQATEVERLRASVELMRPVVEAARRYVAELVGLDDLDAAVDTYETQTGGTDG